MTQARDVDAAYVGREAIFPWEAKVYLRRCLNKDSNSGATQAEVLDRPGTGTIRVALGSIEKLRR